MRTILTICGLLGVNVFSHLFQQASAENRSPYPILKCSLVEGTSIRAPTPGTGRFRGTSYEKGFEYPIPPWYFFTSVFSIQTQRHVWALGWDKVNPQTKNPQTKNC